MSCGVGLCRGEIPEIQRRIVMNALMEKKRPSLEISSISTELKKMITGCWSEDANDRPEFVSLYRELCVSEFEMSSHLKQLSLGGSPSNSSSSTSQGLFCFPPPDLKLLRADCVLK